MGGEESLEERLKKLDRRTSKISKTKPSEKEDKNYRKLQDEIKSLKEQLGDLRRSSKKRDSDYNRLKEYYSGLEEEVKYLRKKPQMESDAEEDSDDSYPTLEEDFEDSDLGSRYSSREDSADYNPAARTYFRNAVGKAGIALSIGLALLISPYIIEIKEQAKNLFQLAGGAAIAASVFGTLIAYVKSKLM